MQIKWQPTALWQYMLDHVRTIILSFILLYIFVGTGKAATYLEWVVGLLVGCVYFALLWLPGWLRVTRTRSAAVIGTWMLTAFYWVMFDAERIAVALVFYLVGYTVLWLPIQLSVLLTGAMIAADAAIFFMLKGQLDIILVYTIAHASTYVLFWGVRVKREATEASKRHYQQLREVHAELEQAYKELQQTHRELEEATVRLLRFAVLEERSRISRDLHDSIGHGLTSVIVQLQALPYIMKMDAGEADISLKTALEVARRCLQDVRTVVHQMAVDEEGLGLVALQSLVKQAREQGDLDIALTVDGSFSKWSSEIYESLYRILQEALTNVFRHANASRVDVEVSESDGELTMTVTDDGIWTDSNPIFPGFGLSSMKARSERVDGVLRIEPVDPHGLRLVVKIPLHVKDGLTEGEGK
ncbi:sensor histidine kinase [Paenibacillus albiflavus]|uniref:histidine kinase n=1 Tax=Paenibacillus albiflavus TaxID=2545760 RepID=A0A4R4ELH4_9BACL|nr:sensor histidine kinase [Paenibacillus albiflavus]TCZ79301.1 sensor histidine kinase [Paenibacillus albiflavus]